MNIAEILQYCPKGTELYSLVDGEVTLCDVDMDLSYPITVYNKQKNVSQYTEDGRLFANSLGECLLFPSKDQRNWSKFRLPVKKGDIVMDINGECPFIATGEFYHDIAPKYICGINSLGKFQLGCAEMGWTSIFYIPASKEAKKELFDKMAEAGYKWNANTLELEKIETKFKEGDVVIDDQGNLCLVSKIRYDGFIIIAAALYTNNVLGSFTSNTVSRSIQLVNTVSTTDRNKLYSALVRKGYKYDKEQHSLIKQEFKPFDKVLVRDNDTDSWKADIYLGYDGECKVYHYKCARANYAVCIPYEGNEYLLDTTDSPM